MKKIFAKPKKLRKASDVEKALHSNPAANSVLRKLRSYLDTTEPELVYFLVNLWKNQGKAITYKEMREAILNGDVNPEWIADWQQDYSKFIIANLQPKWLEAMEAANVEREEKYPEWYFNPAADGVRNWTENRAAELVTQVTREQVDALRAVVRMATQLQIITIDELARAIRPTIGLTKPQSVANIRYYNKLIDSGMKTAKARDLAARYAARQHRWRAYMIARTETATAYNQGALEGAKQAQAKGYLDEDMVKVWCTADDERTCTGTCLPLEGKEYALNDNRVKAPAHPGCRCTWLIKKPSK